MYNNSLGQFIQSINETSYVKLFSIQTRIHTHHFSVNSIKFFLYHTHTKMITIQYYENTILTTFKLINQFSFLYNKKKNHTNPLIELLYQFSYVQFYEIIIFFPMFQQTYQNKINHKTLPKIINYIHMFILQ